MTLVTTMDIKRLVENLDRLYPGAAMPRTVFIPASATARRRQLQRIPTRNLKAT
jgi:hypothetical protein